VLVSRRLEDIVKSITAGEEKYDTNHNTRNSDAGGRAVIYFVCSRRGNNVL
jgi:hypothetical protein